MGVPFSLVLGACHERLTSAAQRFPSVTRRQHKVNVQKQRKGRSQTTIYSLHYGQVSIISWLRKFSWLHRAILHGRCQQVLRQTNNCPFPPYIQILVLQCVSWLRHCCF